LREVQSNDKDKAKQEENKALGGNPDEKLITNDDFNT